VCLLYYILLKIVTINLIIKIGGAREFLKFMTAIKSFEIIKKFEIKPEFQNTINTKIYLTNIYNCIYISFYTYISNVNNKKYNVNNKNI